MKKLIILLCSLVLFSASVINAHSAMMPSSIQNFEGMGMGGGRPDANGAVGPNHYVEIINYSFQVWDKFGTPLTGAIDIKNLWDGVGGACSHSSPYWMGDVIVLYDQLADRWLLSQMGGYSMPPTSMCIAISKTGDPAGDWYPYTFPFSVSLDYPHLAAWPDGYYMGTQSGIVAVFERAKMLNGDPTAGVQQFTETMTCDNFLLPASLDGTPPPAGTPEYFAQFNKGSDNCGSTSDNVKIWEYHVDWANPANTTFGVTGSPNYVLNTSLPAFQSEVFGTGRIAQPGTPQNLDPKGDGLMYRLQYRNFGTYSAMVANHTYDSGGGKAGLRWYELNDNGSGWSIYQQGAYSPSDTESRWMGSIAMDVQGNIALGYNVSSSYVYPSMRYAGRLATDPLDTLAQSENTVITGTGSRSDSNWGDYASMAVDPADGCTFWFTSQYQTNTTSTFVNTRIASFRFPGCGGGPSAPGAPTSVTAQAGNMAAWVGFKLPAGDGGSAITGYTVVSTPAGGVDMNAGTTQLSHTITGLTNGTSYKFKVTATNSVGTGPSSAPSSSVVPQPANAVSINGFAVSTGGAFQYYSSDIVEGSDGNIWFTESAANKIGRITTSGVVTEFPVTANGLPNYITSGPDGNIWFTENSANKVGRITPSGTLTEFPVSGASGLKGIITGPDNNLWFADIGVSRIGRINTSGTILGFFASSFPAEGITVGPDNNIWFDGGNQIEGMTSSGSLIGPFTVPACSNGGAYRLTTGPDHNLWVTNGDCIERMTTSGSFTTYHLPNTGSVATFIVTGPDGNIWFTESSGNRIGKISPTTGALTEFAVPTSAGRPWGLTTGPDNNLWFTAISGNEIGQVSFSFVTRMLGGITVGSYSGVQTAYNACMGGDAVQMQAMTFNENVNLNLNLPVVLKGGYDSAFGSLIGLTTVHGTITISAGTVEVQNVVID